MADLESTPDNAERSPASPEARQRWRLVIRRAADAPSLAPGDWQAAWEHALSATVLPLTWTGSRHPKPRFVAALPLPAGLAADRELADIFLTVRSPRAMVRAEVERVIPAGHALVDCHDVWIGEPSLPGQVTGAEYAIELAGPGPAEARLAASVAAFLAADHVLRQRPRGERNIEYDLRPLVLDLAIRGAPGGADDTGTAAAATVLWMRLRHHPERGPGRPDEVLRELGDRLGMELRAALITRTRILLAGDVGSTDGRPHTRLDAEAEGD